eukprot:5697485-Pyramimonas_sp.AAC.1
MGNAIHVTSFSLAHPQALLILSHPPSPLRSSFLFALSVCERGAGRILGDREFRDKYRVDPVWRSADPRAAPGMREVSHKVKRSGNAEEARSEGTSTGDWGSPGGQRGGGLEVCSRSRLECLSKACAQHKHPCIEGQLTYQLDAMSYRERARQAASAVPAKKWAPARAQQATYHLHVTGKLPAEMEQAAFPGWFQLRVVLRKPPGGPKSQIHSLPRVVSFPTVFSIAMENAMDT